MLAFTRVLHPTSMATTRPMPSSIYTVRNYFMGVCFCVVAWGDKIAKVPILTLVGCCGMALVVFGIGT